MNQSSAPVSGILISKVHFIMCLTLQKAFTIHESQCAICKTEILIEPIHKVLVSPSHKRNYANVSEG